MTEDLRCCGTGTCLINADGFCWCGQRWDGAKMCFPEKQSTADAVKQGASPAGPQPDPNLPNRNS